MTNSGGLALRPLPAGAALLLDDIGKVVHPSGLSLDDVLDRLAADADLRLAFQASYPIAVGS